MADSLLLHFIRTVYFCKYYINLNILKTEELWAEISLKYSTKNLNYGKIDVDICETLAKNFKVAISGFSVQLPVLILFKNGVEVKRFPMLDKKGKSYQAKYYSKKELIKYFELENIYLDTLR